MSSVQLGAAMSVTVFATLGVAGTTWLRLVVASAVLLAAVRPWPLGRADLPAALLGLVMAGNTLAFSSATHRIPLGVAVAVEFSGPLCVAAIGARGAGARRMAAPLAALAGVVLVTRPWAVGDVAAGRTWTGLGLAATAGLGWAGYILLTAHVGRRRKGFGGLAVALAVAAAALAPTGLVQAWPALRAMTAGDCTAARAVAIGALAGLLVPLTAYALEMAALRRLDQGVFGTWMALEPAIGAMVGLALLGQRLTVIQVPGIGLVVAAGITAQRMSRQSDDRGG